VQAVATAGVAAARGLLGGQLGGRRIGLAHHARGLLAVLRTAGGEVADLAGGGHLQAHLDRLALDALLRAQRRDRRAQLRVLTLERARVLDRAADARVELEHGDLHGDDPAERDGDDRDPRAPPQEAVEEGVVRAAP
jgi:hypothetical protein